MFVLVLRGALDVSIVKCATTATAASAVMDVKNVIVVRRAKIVRFVVEVRCVSGANAVMAALSATNRVIVCCAME